jgi:hypothetical protein
MTDLDRRIDQGVGRTPADIVLKGGRFFDLVTGELVSSDIAICGDTIVGTGESYEGREEIDVSGRIVVPGFIAPICTQLAGHAAVRPLRLLWRHRLDLRPHEIANVPARKHRYFS